MAQIVFARIKRDFKEVAKNEDGSLRGIKVEMTSDNDLQHLRGEIEGPPDTPYEGGTFVLDVHVPNQYPFHPPQIKFLTRIWHPNISSATGFICLDILKDQWAASMTLRTIFLSLQALLCSPEPDDPQDAVVAKQFREKRDVFKATARHWAQVYAGAPGPVSEDFRTKIAALKDMGVTEEQARTALSTTSWELPRATEYLFS